jgi:hypothetical protein
MAKVIRLAPNPDGFNRDLPLPFNLRREDFSAAMQDVYDFFHDVNSFLIGRGLERFDDMLRPANMSGFLSDMLTISLARHSRSLTQNLYHNGHPDLILKGKYPNNAEKSGTEGVEIKSTRKPGGAVDTHGARDQWMCVFTYEIDSDTEPTSARKPMRFTEIYLGQVTTADFRKNDRGELGTRTATLDKDGLAKFRQCWLYKDASSR